ncbi:hypothetical protein GCM10018790_20790 [Kitasatospora xanthocidica]|uniref:hypothetical protein n=1 Tax=Kitasatospora xanthocidica TaxID=83382 RepID=UPI00167B7765|nr:hypothetical protein [Kitasatospora xanthocidica]BEK65464.1 hypothetical protein KPHV_26910 [Kitasatospora purpeofusca]GHF42780.1 hypothetical protein GCM10018790_20790 [Kitasatospora xanthocidica]
MSTPAPARPELWFLDTSSLMTLAVDEALREAVKGELSWHKRVLLDVVVEELERLAGAGRPDEKALAAAALGQLDWLGAPVPTDNLGIDPLRVVAVQDILRSGRPLKHPGEHWAESVIMTMAEGLTLAAPHLLSEDYNARIESVRHNCAPYSVHKLLARMVQGGRLAADDAESFADAVMAAGRGNDYTAAEFLSGNLGRVGKP